MSTNPFSASGPNRMLPHREPVEMQRRPLELWGGVECTINRVQDTHFDQLERSGHRERTESDLALFAELGIRTLRTAILWESFAATRSWAAADRMMAALERLDIRPIVGLLHHGSGPATTDLLDAEFPQKLADFALQVAQRFPAVLDYTPVNEPQTTGRFSCLYGHWFPHHRSMRSYMRALCNEVKGTVLAMRAIRTVQPEARLIYTEDGGAIFSSAGAERFRIEREHRRWLGTDLLCGRVLPDHPLHAFLLSNGLTGEEIAWFSDNPCPPSILGLNYYVTSDRFLDDRLALYPPNYAGGDTGDEPLVDFEAVRVRSEGISGAGAILKQAWQRYNIPVAITEAHLGSDAGQQVRWLAEVWQEAETARAEGVDVRAVTAWALLGSYNWCHLCTRDTDAYEPGVFDLSTGVPVETPLVELVRSLASGRQALLADGRSGWWREPSRLTVMPPSGDDLLFAQGQDDGGSAGQSEQSTDEVVTATSRG